MSILLLGSNVDVELAKRELVQVLEWMHRKKGDPLGGLGYSVLTIQTKTHAYRALVALEGRWP